MSTNARLMLPLSLAVASCIADPSIGSRGAAIVGGEADLEHSAVFDILVDGEQSCTGTLISPHAVLTAAHCIVEDVDDATELVVFTGPDESDLGGGKLHEVVAGPYHPLYGTDPVDEEIGDIAVLILAEPSDIPPMRYNRTPLGAGDVGELVTVVGYGDTTVTDPTEGGGTRKRAIVPIQDVDENWVVAGDDPGQSQCYGDSGGPVLMEIDGVEQVIGINSWGETDDCGDPEYNTRVDRFVAFVDEQVQTADPGFDPGGDDDGGDDPGDGDEPGDGGGEPGGDDNPGGDDDGGGPGSPDAVGGCQTSGSSPVGGTSALALLALAALWRRRAWA